MTGTPRKGPPLRKTHPLDQFEELEFRLRSDVIPYLRRKRYRVLSWIGDVAYHDCSYPVALEYSLDAD